MILKLNTVLKLPYLAHYYGDKQYVQVQTKIDSKGICEFKGNKTLDGGIYIVFTSTALPLSEGCLPAMRGPCRQCRWPPKARNGRGDQTDQECHKRSTSVPNFAPNARRILAYIFRRKGDGSKSYCNNQKNQGEGCQYERQRDFVGRALAMAASTKAIIRSRKVLPGEAVI